MSGGPVGLSALRRSVLAAAIFAVLWALLESVLGALLSTPYNLLQVVWWRYATHLAIMLVLTIGNPQRLWRTRRVGFQLGRSLLMFVMPLSFVLALAVGATPEFIWSLFWISPLLMMGLARVFLGERAPRLCLALAALAWAAACLAFGGLGSGNALGLVFAMLMALSLSLYVVMTRSLRGEDIRTNLFYTAFGVFVLLTPLMPTIWIWPTLRDAMLLSSIGAVGLLALLAIDRAVAHSPVSVVAPVFSLQIVAMTFLMWLAGRELYPRREAIAVVVLVLASVAIWWAAPRFPARRTQPPAGARGAGLTAIGARPW